MNYKYQTVYKKLYGRINSSIYRPYEKLPSERELQEEFQVSRHTIRKALNLLESENLITKIRGSGNYVNVYSHKNTDLKVGVISTYISNYIFPDIIHGIEQELSKNKINMLFAITHNDLKKERKALEAMINSKIDGLIIEPTQSTYCNPNVDLYQIIKELEIPYIMINAYYKNIDAPYIVVDDFTAGKMATDYLIKNNHRKIAIVSKIDDMQGVLRLNGFIEAHRTNTIVLEDDNIITYKTNTTLNIYKKILFLIQKNYTAFVIYNDELADQIVEFLSLKKIAVPDDVSIVSFDNLQNKHMSNLSYTSITHPKKKLGRDAARWLTDNINNNKNNDKIIYSPSLFIGNSVKSL